MNSRFLAVPAALVLLGVFSCNRPSNVEPITEVRTLETPRPTPPLNISTAERFGFRMSANPAPSMASSGSTSTSFAWNAPDGWKRGRESQTRLVSYSIGQNNEAECYVSVLPSMGGGLEANVNRWAHQMNSQPLTSDAIAKLPKVKFLGEESPMVEIAGNFSDTMSGKNIANALMLGVIAEGSAGSVFIKMVGPVDVVNHEKDNFVKFCESFRPSTGGTG